VNSDEQNLLVRTARQWGLQLGERQLAQFETYVAELQHWNTQLNLTAVAGTHEIVTRHLLDSLSIATLWAGQAQPARLIDIGAGAGFPGVPLKILLPGMALTLVESVAKKAAFLEHLLRALGLADTSVLTARAEQLGHDPAQRERYDVATARAVAELRVLAEYCLPFVRVGGALVAPKSAQVEDELAAAQPAIQLLGGRVATVQPVRIEGEPTRVLVAITKESATPQRYPRAVGIPAKRPLSGS
jgi:16S rRNA (guanine527-N7)-methyltransferase